MRDKNFSFTVNDRGKTLLGDKYQSLASNKVTLLQNDQIDLGGSMIMPYSTNIADKNNNAIKEIINDQYFNQQRLTESQSNLIDNNTHIVDVTETMSLNFLENEIISEF